MKPQDRTHKEDAYGWKPPENRTSQNRDFQKRYHSKRQNDSDDGYFYQRKDDGPSQDKQSSSYNRSEDNRDTQLRPKDKPRNDFYWNQDLIGRKQHHPDPQNNRGLDYREDQQMDDYNHEGVYQRGYDDRGNHFEEGSRRGNRHHPYTGSDRRTNEFSKANRTDKSGPSEGVSKHWETHSHPHGKSNKSKAYVRGYKLGRGEDRVERCYDSDCLVCLEKIALSSAVWVCKQCSVVTHLKCIQSWLSNLQTRFASEPERRNTFSCPHCNFIYLNESPKHSCFCGKVDDPVPNQFFHPNSCGRTCGKKLNSICDHFCEEVCHPGSCPTCKKRKSFLCYCGRTEKEFDCAQVLQPNALSCGRLCNNVLNCGQHRCESECHEGKCRPCEVVTVMFCHCGKQSKAAPCGFHFACKELCGKTMDCGKHKCGMLCHSGECKPCESVVRANETCFCGNATVEQLLGRQRADCLEDTPTCNRPCDKTLSCGHKCMLKCHSGECDCGYRSQVKCRCGTQKFEVRCCESGVQVLCQTVCSRKMSCFKHSCPTVCCPSKLVKKEDGIHTCKRVCNAELGCGKHDCHKRCHKGPCLPCDAMLSRPLTCACGRETVRPPVLCGTEAPKCARRCNKRLQCGHLCYFDCHFGDCPPCEETVSKFCECGSTEQKDVRCSKAARCNKVCTNDLPCGHQCLQMCHNSNACLLQREHLRVKATAEDSCQPVEKSSQPSTQLLNSSCFSKCNKTKPKCGHKCQAVCHPGLDCPDLPCLTMVKIACPCGMRFEFRECRQATSAESTPIECDNKCKTHKRFRVLFEAKSDMNTVYFAEHLIKYAKDNPRFVGKLEGDLKRMFLEGEERMSLVVEKRMPDRLNFIVGLLTNHYHLEMNYTKQEKGFFVDALTTPDFSVPQVTLSQYIGKMNVKQIGKQHLPFEAAFRFYNLSVFDKIETLEELLKDLKGKFYLERNGGMVSMFIWKSKDAEELARAIKDTKSNWSNFVVGTKKQSNFDFKDCRDAEEAVDLEEEETELNEDSVVTFNLDNPINNAINNLNACSSKNIFERLDDGLEEG